jgi:DNA-binding LytR/AlgR family response regulator
MPELNGMSFLKSLEHRPLVIFATASHEYAVEGFAVDAVDYLIKPFGFERFLKAVTKAHGIFRMNLQSTGNSSPCIFIRSGYKLVKILLDDIEYIEGLNDYIKIVTAKGKAVLSMLPLKEILTQLPASRFIRVHRSFIVPIERINGYNRSQIFLGNTVIPVGVTYLDDVKKLFR